MNRYCSYKKSLQKYITKRSCLKTYFNSTESPTEIYEYVINIINEDILIIPTIFLTIVNTQNKKYNITMQCYYSASAIMFYCVLSKFVSQEKQIIEKFGERIYHDAINNLVASASCSINQGMKTIKSNNHKNLFDMYINLMHIHCKLVNPNFLLRPINLCNTGDNIKKNSDISKWLTKQQNNNTVNEQHLNDQMQNNNVEKSELVSSVLLTNPEQSSSNTNNNNLNLSVSTIANKVGKFKAIKEEEYNEYITRTFGCLCELGFTMGWIQGGGKIDDIQIIKNISKYFAMMYKISMDFENLDDALSENKEVSCNHVINYGIQNSYNIYLENKYQFIEKCINCEIYTNTMQEIVTLIDKNIVSLIDNINPDIMSNMSSC